MAYLKIANWERWQSYRKDRGQPPWIKVHRRLMRDPDYVRLTDAQRGRLLGIWLLAADKDGKIPDDPGMIAQLCYMTKEPDLQLYIDRGFIEKRRQPSDTKTSSRRQDGYPEAEAEAEYKSSLRSDLSEAEAEKSKSRFCAQVVLDHWNSHDALIRHRGLTKKMRDAISSRRKGGYSVEDLSRAISRYAELVQEGCAPGHNHWGLDNLLSRGEGVWLDRMLDPNYQGITNRNEKDDKTARAGKRFLDRRGAR